MLEYIILLLMTIYLVRLTLVNYIRRRAIDVQHNLNLSLIREGKNWRSCNEILYAKSEFLQIIDLRKWKFKQFYPEFHETQPTKAQH